MIYVTVAVTCLVIGYVFGNITKPKADAAVSAVKAAEADIKKI